MDAHGCRAPGGVVVTMIALATAIWHGRAADLNRWIDDAESHDARMRRRDAAGADERLWIEIVEWVEAERKPRDAAACLEAARKAAVSAIEEHGVADGDQTKANERIDMWEYLLRDFRRAGLQIDPARDLRGQFMATTSSMSAAA